MKGIALKLDDKLLKAFDGWCKKNKMSRSAGMRLAMRTSIDGGKPAAYGEPMSEAEALGLLADIARGTEENADRLAVKELLAYYQRERHAAERAQAAKGPKDTPPAAAGYFGGHLAAVK